MKKFLLLLCCLIILPVFADTMPFYMNAIPKTSLGLYQTDKDITLYSEPETSADIVKKMEFSYNPETMPDNVFAVLLNESKLGFLYVTDIEEDGWVQVIYDKITGAKGWVKTSDRMQFMPWRNFYNMYGRKYGLRVLKDAPKEVKDLHAKSDETSQIVNTLNYVKQIKLTTVQGNWALVTASDMDKVPKTGWLKWRNAEGVIYAFPNLH